MELTLRLRLSLATLAALATWLALSGDAAIAWGL